MAAIVDLRCEHLTNPLGIETLRPRLSWRLESDRRGARQTAYRLQAASTRERLLADEPDLWDSGQIATDACLLIPYGGPRLTSRQRIHWRVLVSDESGTLLTSEPAWFEMGLLRRGDWRARWIGSALVGGPHDSIPAPYLRKSFRLATAPVAARLYVTALGLYDCSLNGQAVGEDVFAPGWTDYCRRVQYQVYDVTPLLTAGENVLGAVLGDGWAVGHMAHLPRRFYWDRPRFLAQLEVTLADGSRVTVASDRSWKYRFGPLLANDLLTGETYDATFELPGWDAPGYDDRGWQGVELFEHPELTLSATTAPLVRRQELLSPIGEPKPSGGLLGQGRIFDLGQNMVGRVRLRGSAPAGTTVTLRFAEVLNPDGSLYTENLRSAHATDYYTFRGEGIEVWEPRFTFHGFRYVELLNYPGEIAPDTITGVVLNSDLPATGEFSSSDPIVNQLQHNIVWSQKGNFVDVPTDCPQRDERMGWTGDFQVFVRTAAFNMDIASFTAEWLRDVRDAQHPQGSIPPVVPDIFRVMPDGGPAWADAAIICPWTIYLCYGDRGILADNYAMMTRYLRFVLDASPGYIRCAPDYQGWRGFGDWLSINADTPRDLIGTAFLAYDAQLMAQIATALDKPRDAARYRRLFADVKRAFGKRFLVGSRVTAAEPVAQRQPGTGGHDLSRGNLPVEEYAALPSQVFNTALFAPTQTAYVLALHFGLLPESLRPLAVAELVADIEQRHMHLSTGFVGTSYLPHVLTAGGRLDVVYALFNQRTWPSWQYAVTQGATTIWERWDGWTPERGFQDAAMNSFNHYAYGAIGAWMYNTIAGIEADPAQPGFKHAVLRPLPGGDLTQARGALQTPYGALISEWRLEGGEFRWTVVVPANTTATAHVPEGAGTEITLDGARVDGRTHELVAGRYEFRVR